MFWGLAHGFVSLSLQRRKGNYKIQEDTVTKSSAKADSGLKFGVSRVGV